MRQTPHAGISCENDLGNLMVVGTHEAKALVLGGMVPGRAYGQSALHHELFLRPQGEDPAYEGYTSNQLDYCIESLEPAGCVQGSQNGHPAYRITEFGDRQGKAYVGHVLALSLDAGEIGLRSLFGMARTSGEKASRPPLDRLRIFRELLRADSVQVSEARDVMGISQNAASRALLWLDASEIVDYESMAPQSIADQLTYTFPENFELPSGQAEVKQMVYDLLAELVAEGRQHSLGGILSALRSRYPDQGFDGQSRRTYTIGLMNRLVKAGSITKNMDGKRRRSTITLREEARPIIERTVAIADGMLEEDDDFLREGRQELRVILSDPERVRTLVGKAFKASPEANGLPFADRYSHVAAVLRGRAGTSSEIAEAVKAHGMTLASTQNTLEVMRRRGLAIAERVPGFSANRWELIEASPVAA